MKGLSVMAAWAAAALSAGARSGPYEVRTDRRIRTPVINAGFGRLYGRSVDNKYPGQSTRYLIGAHCEEGRRMREAAR